MISLAKQFLSVFMATALFAFVILFVVSDPLPTKSPTKQKSLTDTPIQQMQSPSALPVTQISYENHPGLVFMKTQSTEEKQLENEASPTPSPTEIPSSTPTPTLLPSPTITPTQPPLTPTPTEILPTLTPIPTTTPVTVSDIDGFFSKYSSYYSVDQEKLKRIARCESGMNPTASNLQYAGMFQFGPGTWEAVRQRMNLETNDDLRYNAEEAIKTAAFYISINGEHAWPNCQ